MGKVPAPPPPPFRFQKGRIVSQILFRFTGMPRNAGQAALSFAQLILGPRPTGREEEREIVIRDHNAANVIHADYPRRLGIFPRPALNYSDDGTFIFADGVFGTALSCRRLRLLTSLPPAVHLRLPLLHSSKHIFLLRLRETASPSSSLPAIH